MAAQIGALRVSLSADTARFEQGMRRAQQRARRSSRDITSSLDRVGASLRNIAGAAGITFGAAGAMMAARSFLRVADAAKTMEASLRLATAQSGNFAQAQEDVRRVATLTRSGLQETSDLYGAFMRNAAELGITQEQAARATQTVASAFSISGASASEAANATRQFMQALQSGTLRGDEFNSVMENAPRLARLLADSLGKTVGELRAMAEAGELTRDRLARALTDQRFTAAIDEEFRQMPVTFDQAMNGIHNAATVAFGAFDRGGSFSQALVNFMVGGVDNLDQIERKAEETGIVIRSVFAGLNNVFEPMRNNASDVFSAIHQMSLDARNDIAAVFAMLDSAARGLRNLTAIGASLGNPAQFGLTRESLPGVPSTAQAYRTGTRRSEREAQLEAEQRRMNDRLNNQGFDRWLADPATYDMQGNRRRPLPQRPAARSGRGGGGRANPNRETGRQWTAAEAAEAFRARGFDITSVVRTPAQQQALIRRWERENPRTRGIRPAGLNGPHVQNRGIDFSRRHSIAEIRTAARELGIPIGQLLNEGDHKHLTIGGRGGRGGRNDAERLAREAERRRIDAIRDEHRRASELRDAETDILRERQRLSNDVEERAQLEQQILNAAREQERADLVMAVRTGEMSEIEAAALNERQQQVHDLRLQGVAQEQIRERLEESWRLEDARFRLKQEELQSHAALAETANERRRLELEILALTYRERAERLKRILADERSTDAERVAARQEIAGLPGSQAREREGILRSTRGPLEDFLSTLPTTAERANEALQAVAANGLQSITDGLADAIMMTRSWGDVFKNIARQIISDLIRIQLQRSLIGPLANALGGLMPGAGGAMKIPGKAAGGPVLPGRMYVVGEKGPELLRMGNSGGQIIPNHQIGGGQGRAVVQLQLTSDLDARIIGVAGPVAVEVVRTAAPKIQEGTIKTLTRPELA